MLCTASKGGDIGLCAECLNGLPWHRQPHCPQCGLTSSFNQFCGHCLKSSPAFDLTRALFRYEYPLDAMLQRYKYTHLLTMANTLGQLMADSFIAGPDAIMPDVIIPMPLHQQRLQERGFNQAVEIAKVISKQLGLTLDTKSCIRVKLAPPQVSLPLKQRVKNMRGAFNCNSSMHGKRVALVDDVMTTGASLNELAKTVKSAGAAHVECWVVARTQPR